jgi:hypothetical protein
MTDSEILARETLEVLRAFFDDPYRPLPVQVSAEFVK